MTNLARFDGNNGVELIINTVTGESFASISGYARLSGKDKSTISRRLQTVALDNVKQAEIQTVSGIKTVALIPEHLIVEWLPKDNPQMATQLMKLGVRVFLHQLAGFEVKSSAVNTPKTYLEALKALVASEEEKLALEAQKVALESKIEKDAPLVQYAETVRYSETSVEFHEFAKMIKHHGGRNIIMRKLREMGILMKDSTIPYQKYINAGYFEVNQEIDSKGHLIPFATITGKGQIWLHQKLVHHDNLTTKAINAIAQGVLSFSL